MTTLEMEVDNWKPSLEEISESSFPPTNQNL
jgi:hypothetical protein